MAQVRELVRRLGDSGPIPLFVFDAGYDPIALSHELRDDRAAVLLRSGRWLREHPDSPPEAAS